MKVKNLIKRLQKLNQDKEINISCDEEGNRIFNNVSISKYDIGQLGDYCIFPDESTEVEYI